MLNPNSSPWGKTHFSEPVFSTHKPPVVVDTTFKVGSRPTGAAASNLRGNSTWTNANQVGTVGVFISNKVASILMLRSVLLLSKSEIGIPPIAKVCLKLIGISPSQSGDAIVRFGAGRLGDELVCGVLPSCNAFKALEIFTSFLMVSWKDFKVAPWIDLNFSSTRSGILAGSMEGPDFRKLFGCTFGQSVLMD